MDRRAIIFGHGGHSRVVRSLLEGRYADFRFVDVQERDGTILEARFFDDPGRFAGADVYLGIGDNGVRRALFGRLKSLGFTMPTCISPDAVVFPDAEVGPGTVICPGAVVMTAVRIGENSIINTHSSIDHDSVVGAHCHVAAGVTFGGTTAVGTECFFGIKSATVPNVRIGDRAVIMAGSLVTRDVPAGVVVGGYPAVVVKQRAP
jgi:sugar O-acyltransferase (sialic acid O-acetyltransferase NeuD family)